MKRITHNRAISQGGKRDNTDLKLDPERRLAEVHDSAYSEITQPQKVVVVPRYFITHWLPLLGPSPAWLVLAFRQAAFVSQCPQPEAVRALPVRKLSSWAGLSHGQIWNLIQQPGWLEWFVRRVIRSTQRQESDVWGVQTSIPVAPHHLLEIQRRATAALQNLPAIKPEKLAQIMLEDTSEILYGTDSRPAENPTAPHSIQDIFEELFGTLDSKTTQLLEEFAGRITQPGNTIAISHYFIKRWRPQLTSGEAWLVHLLRTQVYSTRQSTSYLAVEGGKTQIARALGVHTRSVRRWFENLAENPVGQFISEHASQGNSNSLGLTVQMIDPLHAQDLKHYEQLRYAAGEDKSGQRGGQKWTEKGKDSGREEDKAEQGDGQKGTGRRAELNKKEDISEQDPGQDWTANRPKMDALIDLNKPSNFIQSNPQQPLKKQLLASPEGEWLLDKMFQSAGISRKKRAQLQRRLQKNQAAVKALIAWLLYGYEHRTASGAGITSPVLFAISRYADNLPAPKYAALAGLSPGEIGRLIRNRFAPDIGQDLKNTLLALEANGFLDLLAPHSPAAISDESKAIMTDAPPDPEPDSAPVKPAPASLARVPSSAEEIWDAVRQTAQVPGDLAPVSLWLNERTLALSFIHEDQAFEVADAIETRRGELCLRLPGYAFQLRTLEMRQSGSQPLPVVGIKSEKTISL